MTETTETTIKIEFEFTVDSRVLPNAIADEVFDILCAAENPPYRSCDGWDVTDDGL